MTPRCPDCDIEMLYAGDDFTCPLCGGNNVVSHYRVKRVDTTDYVKVRDDMTECAELLLKVIERNPEITDVCRQIYQWCNERAEEYDTKANAP